MRAGGYMMVAMVNDWMTNKGETTINEWLVMEGGQSNLEREMEGGQPNLERETKTMDVSN